MKSDMDNRLWLNDYLSIQQVKTDNPFTVPDGYFDALHQSILSRAVIDGVNAENNTGLTVPDGYFDDMAATLQSRIAVEAAMENAPAMSVPEGYFEQMQADLHSRINMEEALQNSEGDLTVPQGYFEEMQANLQSRIMVEEALQHTTGDFTIPAGYFEDQYQQIKSRIMVEELLNRESEGFVVPANYFDQLQSNIISKTAQPKPAVKRNAVIRKLFATSTYKYATAACFLVAIGATLIISKFESPEAVHERSYIHKALAAVPDADLAKYLEISADVDAMPNATQAAGSKTDAADAEALKKVLDL